MVMTFFEQVQDWVYDNYQAAYVIGTGAIALCGWLADPKKRAGRALGIYAGVLAAGAVMEPCVNVTSQKYGPVLARASTARRVAALTFDDGPSAQNTGKLLDVLKEEGVKATFFCVGHNALRYPDLVKRMESEGHLVGSHTYSHRNLLACTPKKSCLEIEKGIEAVESVLGHYPRWFRPPYGMRYPWTLLEARNLGQTAVLWSNCPRDWQRPGADVIASRVVNRMTPGDIVLLHDGGGDRAQTIFAVKVIIRALRAKGYEFVRADEMQHIHAQSRSAALP